jgi:hypothetical protein
MPPSRSQTELEFETVLDLDAAKSEKLIPAWGNSDIEMRTFSQAFLVNAKKSSGARVCAEGHRICRPG